MNNYLMYNNMNGNNYKAPLMCVVQDSPMGLICTSNVDDMSYIDGDWDSDLVI